MERMILLILLYSLYPKDMMPNCKEELRIRRPRFSKANMGHITSKAFQVGLLSKFSSLQSLSCVQLFAIPWTAAGKASLSITNYQSLLKLMSIMLVMPSNHLILCHPLLLLPSIFPGIRVFSSESVFRIRWPNYWSFSFSISPSNEYSGLISFRVDCFELFAVQGTLKSLLQNHSSKALFLWCSAFFVIGSILFSR